MAVAEHRVKGRDLSFHPKRARLLGARLAHDHRDRGALCATKPVHDFLHFDLVRILAIDFHNQISGFGARLPGRTPPEGNDDLGVILSLVHGDLNADADVTVAAELLRDPQILGG